MHTADKHLLFNKGSQQVTPRNAKLDDRPRCLSSAGTPYCTIEYRTRGSLSTFAPPLKPASLTPIEVSGYVFKFRHYFDVY